MQLTLSKVIMQVPTPVAIMQVLRFYCNYVGCTFRYIYIGGSFCSNYACVTVSVAIMQLEVFAAFMQVKVSAANMWRQFLLKLCTWESLLPSCRWYFVIMQVTVSAVAMYVTVSSSNFIFLSLTGTHFS